MVTGPVGPDRRTVLRFAVAAAGALLAGAAGCAGAPRTVRLAAGEPGGFYLEFAQLLAAALREARSDLVLDVVATRGSQENLAALADGRAELALALADTADEAGADRLRAVGRVYENYLQLVVLADGPVRTVADLAGRTISSGADGSGAELTGRRVLVEAGLGPATTAAGVRLRTYPLADAVAALEGGDVDALVWSGGVPTPALAGLAARRGVRLVPLGSVVAPLRARFGPVYEPVTVPAEAYGQGVEVVTVGVPNLLVCTPAADPGTVGALARVLVERAVELVPRPALGTQFLDPGSLIVTGAIPLHPGAAAAYRDLHG